MNEYQDQETWYEVRVKTGPGTWHTLMDTDSRADAEESLSMYEGNFPDKEYKIVKVRGLA